MKSKSDASYTYPLEIIHNTQENEFYYQWTGSTTNTPQGKTMANPLAEGKKLPDFTVELLNGEQLNITETKDNIIVINWWSITCSPCIAEIPGFNKLIEKYSSNNRIVFLAIAWDSEERVKTFLENMSFKYQQALYNDRTVELFGGAFPRNVVVNSDGRIVYNHLGANKHQWKKLDQVISTLLKN